MERRGKTVYWLIIIIAGVIGYLLHEYNGLDDDNFQIVFCVTYIIFSMIIFAMLEGKFIDILALAKSVGKGLSIISSKLSKSGIDWLNRQELSDYKIKPKLPSYDVENEKIISPGIEIRKEVNPTKKIGFVQEFISLIFISERINIHYV